MLSQKVPQVLAVSRLAQVLHLGRQLFWRDPAGIESDFFKASHLQALPVLNSVHKLTRFQQ